MGLLDEIKVHRLYTSYIRPNKKSLVPVWCNLKQCKIKISGGRISEPLQIYLQIQSIIDFSDIFEIPVRSPGPKTDQYRYGTKFIIIPNRAPCFIKSINSILNLTLSNLMMRSKKDFLDTTNDDYHSALFFRGILADT